MCVYKFVAIRCQTHLRTALIYEYETPSHSHSLPLPLIYSFMLCFSSNFLFVILPNVETQQQQQQHKIINEQQILTQRIKFFGNSMLHIIAHTFDHISIIIIITVKSWSFSFRMHIVLYHIFVSTLFWWNYKSLDS